MGNMVVGLLVVTVQIEMTRLEMEGSWTLLIGEVIHTGTILVLVLMGITIIIIIILIEGVIGDIFRIISRKKSDLHLMGK